MPRYSPRVANNFMLLSILFGNMLVALILFSARYISRISGEVGASIVGLLMLPGVPLIIGQLCVALIPFFVYLLVTGQRVSDILPLKPIGPLNLFLIAMITITLMPLATLMVIVTMLLFGIGNNVDQMLGEVTQTSFGLAFIIIVIVPSVFEEITMRGIVLSNYRNVDIHKAALVNGLFFGIFHLNPIQFMYAFLLGYVFALMVFYTKSIYSAIFAHFVFNGTQMLLFRFAQEYFQNQADQGEIVQIPDISTPEMLLDSAISYAIVAAIFTPVAILLFKSFKGINRKNNLREEFETRPLENDGTHKHGGLAVSTYGSAGLSSDDFDMAHVKLPDASQGFQDDPGDQRIVTAGFVLTIIMYIVFVIVFFV